MPTIPRVNGTSKEKIDWLERAFIGNNPERGWIDEQIIPKLEYLAKGKDGNFHIDISVGVQIVLGANGQWWIGDET